MNGAAPGAKLVSVRACLFVAGCTSHALDEGMIYAVEQAGVDVINMSIGGLDPVNDGNTAREQLYNRADRRVRRADVHLRGQRRRRRQHDQPARRSASKVMSVGSYITKASWQRNYGSNAAHQENLHPFSGRGPREDGGFKPDIIAPGSAISTIPTWMAGGPGRRHLRAAAGLRDAAGHLDGIPAGRRRRGAAGQRRAAAARAAHAGAAAPGVEVHGPAILRTTRPTSRATGSSTCGRRGSAPEGEHHGHRHHLVGRGPHGAVATS